MGITFRTAETALPSPYKPFVQICQGFSSNTVSRQIFISCSADNIRSNNLPKVHAEVYCASLTRPHRELAFNALNGRRSIADVYQESLGTLCCCVGERHRGYCARGRSP